MTELKSNREPSSSPTPFDQETGLLRRTSRAAMGCSMSSSATLPNHILRTRIGRSRASAERARRCCSASSRHAGERAGWLCLERELGDRHRDDTRLAEAIAEDCAALIRRCSSLAGLGDAIERAWQYVRPRRVSVGEVGYEPAYEDRVARRGRDDPGGARGPRRCPRADGRPGRALPVRRSPPARRRPTPGAIPALVAPGRVRTGAADIEPGATGRVWTADPQPEPQAGPDVRRADVPPRGHRPSPNAKMPGMRSGFRSRAAVAPSISRWSARSWSGRPATRTSCSSSAASCAAGSVGLTSFSRTTSRSSRASSTNSTSHSSRTAISSPEARPAGPRRDGPRWRAPLDPEPAPLPRPTSRTWTSSSDGSLTVASSTARRAAPMTSPCPCSACTCAGARN